MRVAEFSISEIAVINDYLEFPVESEILLVKTLATKGQINPIRCTSVLNLLSPRKSSTIGSTFNNVSPSARSCPFLEPVS